MPDPKIIALYLPQYHAIPENDEWWGKGFTEWTNVKKARPLYAGHNQPRVPLGGNYYDLRDPKTFERQVSLAKEYGIDAFCFYHYWFNGRLLLQAPLEDYLARKELDLPFCFSWANEPWTRSWDGRNRSILMDQIYGGREDITDHFNYMLPFFRDPRYIKKDGKPVFVLYRAESVSYLPDMIDIWNGMAADSGFDGIFFVETLSGFQPEKHSGRTGACFYFEPSWSGRRTFFRKVLNSLKSPVWRNHRDSYGRVWKRILAGEDLSPDRWAGAFVDWDNSPRKGRSGYMLDGATPEMFRSCFSQLLCRMREADCPVCFINAWNEWGEGTYLEPDERNGYGYLEAVRDARNGFSPAAAGQA